MKTLLAYFSHTGHTERIARAITEDCPADVERIEEVAAREGFWRYFLAGRDAWRKRKVEIKPVKFDPDVYDLVIVGTPVWAWNLTPAMRTYLETYGGRLKRVAFFCTEGGAGAEGVFKQMADLCGKDPVATLVVTEPELKKADYSEKVKAFASSLTKIEA